jgi:hypothetical protein
MCECHQLTYANHPHNASAASAQSLEANAAGPYIGHRGVAISLTFSGDTAAVEDDAEAGDGNGALAAAAAYTCGRDDHAPRLGDIPSEGAHSPR